MYAAPYVICEPGANHPEILCVRAVCGVGVENTKTSVLLTKSVEER